MILTIIGCVKTKLPLAPGKLVAAKDLYTSPLFKKRRRYAEERGQRWLILSAKHGLLEPDDKIAAYDTKIQDVPPLAAGFSPWHLQVSKKLAKLGKSIEVELHAGADYLLRFQECLELGVDAQVNIHSPMAGKRMGEQLNAYNTIQRLGGRWTIPR